MASSSRAYSRLAKQAVLLLAKQIELARKSRRMSESELASRIGVARSTVQRIEKGMASVEIGTYFEAATVLGVPLFTDETSTKTLMPQIENTLSLIALMPKRARRISKSIKDDF